MVEYMKVLTNVSVLKDEYIGLRIAATYSVIDDETGRIKETNKRIDFAPTSPDTESIKDLANDLMNSVQSYLNTMN